MNIVNTVICRNDFIYETVCQNHKLMNRKTGAYIKHAELLNIPLKIRKIFERRMILLEQL